MSEHDLSYRCDIANVIYRGSGTWVCRSCGESYDVDGYTTLTLACQGRELTTLRARVQELEAKVPKWVSVEDEMPDENENVWISGLSPQDGERFCTDAKFYGGAFYLFDPITDAFSLHCDVADFWQPITPPEDSSDED